MPVIDEWPVDRFTSLLLFTRIVESGSLSAAARHAKLSQPTVSKQLTELEARLGAQLLQRTTRQLSLTEVGSAFYIRAKRILAELDEAEADAADLHGSPRGTLRVGAPVAFGRLHVMLTLPAFLQRYPRLVVDLVMSDRFTDLVEDGADVVIRVGKLSDMSLIARHIGRSARVCVASPAYLATRGEPRIPKDLLQHDCIVYTLLATGNEWHFSGPSATDAVRVQGPFRANNADAVRQATLAGLGIAVAPTWLVADDVAAGTLRRLLPDWTPSAVDVSVLYAPTPRIASKVRAFVDHVVAVFQANGLLD